MSAKQQALEFLNQHSVGVLSTVSKDGKPWGSAIYFAVNSKLNVYFITHVDTKKYRNLKHDAHASLTVVNDAEQITVQAAGLAEELDPFSQEYSEAFREIAAIYPPGETHWAPPVSKMDSSKIVLMRFRPETLHVADFSGEEPKTATEKFGQD